MTSVCTGTTVDLEKERLEISLQASPKNSQLRRRHDILQRPSVNNQQPGSGDWKSLITDGWKAGASDN